MSKRVGVPAKEETSTFWYSVYTGGQHITQPVSSTTFLYTDKIYHVMVYSKYATTPAKQNVIMYD